MEWACGHRGVRGDARAERISESQGISRKGLASPLRPWISRLAWRLRTWWFSKPDLTMALNGVLGRWVAITANCDRVAQWESLLIGAIA